MKTTRTIKMSTITLTNAPISRYRRSPRLQAPQKAVTPMVPANRPATAEAHPEKSDAGCLQGGDLMYHLYLREVGQVPLLTREQETDLALRIRAGDEAAREEMIKANLRLVVKIAHDFEGHGLPLLDLISEGNIGLMKAADRFDPTRGAKFSTYAAWWIKQQMRRAVSNQLRTVRLPIHAQEKLLRIDRAAARLQGLLGREASDAEISGEVGLPEAKVARLRGAAVRPTSLEEPLADEDSKPVSEVVPDEQAADPAEQLLQVNNAELVNEILQELDPREKTILRYRFGLDGDGERTLGEIGDAIGITREYVRLIQNRALRKLRERIAAIEPATCVA